MGTNRCHGVASGVLAVLGLAALPGCGSSSASSRAGSSGATAAVTSLSTTPGAGSPLASPAPVTSTVPAAPPVAASGSGGTSQQTGTLARTVTTTAQPGLPSIQVGYTLFVPSGYVYDPAKPVALVVSELTPASYWQPIAEAEGFLVAEQQGYLGNGGFTFDYDPLVLQGILQDVSTTWNVDSKAIYLTGFSAGAHWSYEIGLENADLFAGLGICSGDLYTAIQDGVWIQGSTVQPSVPRAIPVSIRQGTQDTVVPVAAARFSEAQLLLAHFPVDYAEFAGGHTVDTGELQGIWDFLKTQRLP
jgi:hypothetical protein